MKMKPDPVLSSAPLLVKVLLAIAALRLPAGLPCAAVPPLRLFRTAPLSRTAPAFLRAAIFPGLLLFHLACSDIDAPLRTPSRLYPAAPAHLQAQTGDRLITLSWSAPAGEILRYYIYRRDSLNSRYQLLDSCTATAWLDEGLANGRLYTYCAAACSRSGYCGPLSAPVSARPGLYSLLINDGAVYTRQTLLTLRFIAPAGTRYVRIAADSALNGAAWQLYSQTMNYSLMPGDGLVRLYAIFLDGEGNQTAGAVSDDIIFDTTAAIRSLLITNGTGKRRIGEVLHLEMQTGEAWGAASVDIGSLLTDIHLYDDGSHGDAAAHDGCYTHDYQIPFCHDVANASLFGWFVDVAGNISDSFISPQTLTIENPPAAVHLFAPERLGSRDDALQLSWTVSAEPDFSHYKLFRALTPAVDSAAILVRVLTPAAANLATDSLLAYNRTWYYRLYVFDQQGLGTGSNVVGGSVVADAAAPLQPVLLALPAASAPTVLRLTWSSSRAGDFAGYRLYRSRTETVDSTGVPIAIINNAATTSHDDTGLSSGTAYYYRIFVVNMQGECAGSNTVRGMTSS